MTWLLGVLAVTIAPRVMLCVRFMLKSAAGIHATAEVFSVTGSALISACKCRSTPVLLTSCCMQSRRAPADLARLLVL